MDSAACVIGDAVEGGNTIANNQAGVWVVLPGLPLYGIRANSISSNGGLGIVSGPAPVIRPNAAGALDNFPLIVSVTSDGTDTTIQGVYRGAPNCPVGIDFFASPVCSRRPRDFEEGETYLGSQDGQSRANGEFAFDVTLPLSSEDVPRDGDRHRRPLSVPSFAGWGVRRTRSRRRNSRSGSRSRSSPRAVRLGAGPM